MKQKAIHMICFLFLVATWNAQAGFVDESQNIWSHSTNDIQIALTSVESSWAQSDDAEFQVALRNVGKKDVFLNLGITLANGRSHFPTAISLLLVDPEGHSRKLQLSGPPVIAGRVDDYAVGLSVGSLHVLRLRLSEFWSPHSNEFRINLPRGHYKITARFHGHGALHKNTDMPWTAWNFWEGALESREVEFDVRETK